jgi:hypothetical protein
VVNLLAVASVKASDQLDTQALSRINHRVSSERQNDHRPRPSDRRLLTTGLSTLDPVVSGP